MTNTSIVNDIHHVITQKIMSLSCNHTEDCESLSWHHTDYESVMSSHKIMRVSSLTRSRYLLNQHVAYIEMTECCSQVLTVLHIWEVLGLNPSPETAILTKLFLQFSAVPPGKSRIMP